MKGPPLSAGGSSEVFAWGEGRVVKLFRPGHGHLAPMELERARAAQASGAPCPGVHGLVEAEGRPGIVFDRVDGPLLIVGVRERPEAIGRQLAALHGALHRLSGERLPSVQEVALAALARIPEEEHAAHRARVARLPVGDRLGHGDFHPGNVIRAESGPVVVDWPNAARCAPGTDVARSFVLMRFGIGEDRHARSLAARLAMRRALTDSYLAHVLAAGPARREDVEATLPLVADAILRQVPGHVHEAALKRLAAGEEGLP